jgi:hypothetical protein
MRYQWTSVLGGNFQVCFANSNSKEVEFDFNIQVGVDAKDYTNIITKKHLRPIELQSQKVQDMVK